MHCCAPFCRNGSENVATSGDITFHKFPPDKVLRSAWIEALGKQDHLLNDSAVVCSQHFLDDAFYYAADGSRQVCTGVIPSAVLVCMLCLDTNRKLVLLSKYKLEETYKNLTGHAMGVEGNLKQALCIECTQRLNDFEIFRSNSIKAHSVMIDLVKKYRMITMQHVEQINSVREQLKSDIVKTVVAPDYCDVYIKKENFAALNTENNDTIHTLKVKIERIDEDEASEDSVVIKNEIEDPLEDKEENTLDDKLLNNPWNVDDSIKFECSVCSKVFYNEDAYYSHNHDTNEEYDKSLLPHQSNTQLHSPHNQNKHIQDDDADPHRTSVTVMPTKQGLNNQNNVEICGDLFEKIKMTQEDNNSYCSRSEFNDTAGTPNDRDVSLTDNITNSVKVNKTSGGNEKMSINKQISLKEYFCEQCEYKCNIRTDFLRHMKKHKKNFSCNLCNFSCSYKYGLGRHMRIHTGEKPFSCKLCEYACNQKSSLESHMRTHTGEKPFACNLCKFASKNKKTLVNHLRIHTGEKPFSCKLCDYASNEKRSLNSHMRTHTGEKPFKCYLSTSEFNDTAGTSSDRDVSFTDNITNNVQVNKTSGGNEKMSVNKQISPEEYFCEQCEYKCNIRTDFLRHMKKHKKNFSCNLCNFSCRYKYGLGRHMRIHTGEKPFSCKFCKYASNQKGCLESHMRTHTGEKPFACNLCKYASKIKKNLINHIRIHTGEKPFSCKLCGYACRQKNRLTIHMRIHTGEKPFSCKLCDYASNEKSCLKNHMRTHTGEKPFLCNLCEYASINHSSLANHMRIHTDEKSFSCKLCEYTCSQKSLLIIHTRIHTGEKSFSCKLCQYVSNEKSDFESHMRTHTGEKIFLCDLCEYATKNRSYLVNHIRIHTGEKPFSCKLCKYACRQKSRLISHMRIHTGENPFSCKLCKYAGINKDNLAKHMKTHQLKK